MKPNEIKKTLRHCYQAYIESDGSFCNGCPYRNKSNCNGDILKDALNLIHFREDEIDQHKKEIDRLNAQIAVLQGWGVRK